MNGVKAYQDTAVTTQSKGRIVVMLYEGAIKFLKLAIKEMEEGNFADKGKYITRAQDIINELNVVLNLDEGGEIAHSLRKLYNFNYKHLSSANVKKDIEMIQDVIDVLETLNKGWKAVAG
ncbi:MAG: flagellar export chaperone FliS [Planctomycetota bacterium]|jgi:flagellar protein FliS